MKENKLYIPKKIKVGFNTRNGTFTGKLGYVIYYDELGNLRKEASFNSWIDKNIGTEEYDNTPMSGFVLNKHAGGKGYSSWNSRNEYIRVYDPRGFEFEITLHNLLFILANNDCNKGKGLEGEFIYSWDKTELVLLPKNTLEYKNSEEFTRIKFKKIKKKELIIGAEYLNKDVDSVIYLGEYPYYFTQCFYNYCNKITYSSIYEKRFIFFNLKNNKFLYEKNINFLAELKNREKYEDTEKLLHEYLSGPRSGEIIGIELKDDISTDIKNKIAIKEENYFISIHNFEYSFEKLNHQIYMNKVIFDEATKKLEIDRLRDHYYINPSYTSTYIKTLDDLKKSFKGWGTPKKNICINVNPKITKEVLDLLQNNFNISFEKYIMPNDRKKLVVKLSNGHIIDLENFLELYR